MTVSEHEATLFAGVGVQVNIDLDLAIIRLLFDNFFNSPDRWLFNWIRIKIVPVQVLGKRVQTEIAAVDSVRIEHGHNFKHEFISKYFGLYALFISEKLPNA